MSPQREAYAAASASHMPGQAEPVTALVRVADRESGACGREVLERLAVGNRVAAAEVVRARRRIVEVRLPRVPVVVADLVIGVVEGLAPALGARRARHPRVRTHGGRLAV